MLSIWFWYLILYSDISETNNSQTKMVGLFQRKNIKKGYLKELCYLIVYKIFLSTKKICVKGVVRNRRWSSHVSKQNNKILQAILPMQKWKAKYISKILFGGLHTLITGLQWGTRNFIGNFLLVAPQTSPLWKCTKVW